jgi:hydroxypyruvate reductase 1
MAVLAAANVAGLLAGRPAWNRPDIMPFLGEAPPAACPSILNAGELGIPLLRD